MEVISINQQKEKEHKEKLLKTVDALRKKIEEDEN